MYMIVCGEIYTMQTPIAYILIYISVFAPNLILINFDHTYFSIKYYVLKT